MYFKNEVIIEGRLTDKPIVKENDNHKKFGYFSVCYNENKKDQNGEWHSTPHFFRCTCWGKEAEFAESLDKGCAVSIVGKLVYNEWTDKDNQKKNSTNIAAFHIRKFDLPKKEGNTAENDIPTTDAEEMPDESELPKNPPF